MQNKKITVITVCYNAAESIESTILSVLNQTHSNLEYIIIDGGSTDGTVGIIKKYSDKIAYWVSEPDKGIYDAMNKGIDAATGDYINFMNAGDGFYDNEVLSNFMPFIKNNVSVIFGRSVKTNGNGYEKLEIPIPFYTQGKRIKSPGICHQATFVETSLLKKKKFDIDFKIAADFNLLNILYKEGFKFEEVPLIISRYDSFGISAVNHSERIREFSKISGFNENSLVVKVHIIMFYIKQFIRSAIL